MPASPEYLERVRTIESMETYDRPRAYGIGLATLGGSGQILDADFFSVNLDASPGVAAVISGVIGGNRTGSYRPSTTQLRLIVEALGCFANDGDDHPNLDALVGVSEHGEVMASWGHRVVPLLAFVTNLDDAPVDPGDTYLRLVMLSRRLVEPNTVSLEGAFGRLNNVVWTNHGPIDPDLYDRVRIDLRKVGGHLHVYGIDKFPRMVDYVVPRGVRIADASRVRLGAYLGEGTVVMHEGFVNFNAGTVGPNMVEGRISQGIVVGADSDFGGGCSAMGTLSGGGKEMISVGERCLIGANGGIGISLGNDCTIEAGLYITAGTPVTAIGWGDDGSDVAMKARDLSGQDNLLFLRNGLTGRVEVRPNNSDWGGLNEALH